MTAEQRKRRAIEHLQEKLDEAREQDEWDAEEQAQQTVDDNAELGRQAELHPLMRSEKSPGVRRAEASVRAILRARDEVSGEDEVRIAFGIGDDDRGDDRDDEDDFIG